MKQPYLEITYRKGLPLAAYYYLPRKDGDRSFRTRRVEGGMVVDYSQDDRPIGIEITTPGSLDLAQLNRILESLGQKPATKEELAPLNAA